jgi:hypothetical protein
MCNLPKFGSYAARAVAKSRLNLPLLAGTFTQHSISMPSAGQRFTGANNEIGIRAGLF